MISTSKIFFTTIKNCRNEVVKKFHKIEPPKSRSFCLILSIFKCSQHIEQGVQRMNQKDVNHNINQPSLFSIHPIHYMEIPGLSVSVALPLCSSLRKYQRTLHYYYYDIFGWTLLHSTIIKFDAETIGRQKKIEN